MEPKDRDMKMRLRGPKAENEMLSFEIAQRVAGILQEAQERDVGMGIWWCVEVTKNWKLKVIFQKECSMSADCSGYYTASNAFVPNFTCPKPDSDLGANYCCGFNDIKYCCDDPNSFFPYQYSYMWSLRAFLMRKGSSDRHPLETKLKLLEKLSRPGSICVEKSVNVFGPVTLPQNVPLHLLEFVKMT
eukprot:g39538.t1